MTTPTTDAPDPALTDQKPLTVLVDTREQLPYEFSNFDVTVERRTLLVGDYAFSGAKGLGGAVIERKTLDDLVACLMGANRDRFERELMRLSGYEMSAVVVEASMDNVSRHRYRSRMQPHAVLQSLITFQVRYRVPFVWAGSRKGAEYVTHGLLTKFKREIEGELATRRLRDWHDSFATRCATA